MAPPYIEKVDEQRSTPGNDADSEAVVLKRAAIRWGGESGFVT